MVQVRDVVKLRVGRQGRHPILGLLTYGTLFGLRRTGAEAECSFSFLTATASALTFSTSGSVFAVEYFRLLFAYTVTMHSDSQPLSEDSSWSPANGASATYPPVGTNSPSNP